MTFGPVEFGEWYDSEYSKDYRFGRVTQEVQTVYTSGGDDTYAGKNKDFTSTRSAFTRWDINAKKEDFLTDILSKTGKGRIISVIGCDLFSILTEDQIAGYEKLIDDNQQDEAEELLAKWSENYLKSNDKGEVLDYRGLDMFGQYFYRRDPDSPDIDLRASDYARIMAQQALEQEEAPQTAETPAKQAVKVPAGLVPSES